MSQFPRRSNIMEISAKSVNEAVEAALNQFNVSEEDIEIEVIDEGSKGFLGIGARPAVVKITLKDDEDVKPAKSAEKSSKKAVSGNPEKTAEKFLGDILKAMGLEVKIDSKFDGDTVSIELSGDNMGIVIGKRGDTLDSLQYLTSLVVNQESEDYIKVSIDTENYRAKRTEALIALSNRLAEKVTRTGKRFTLEPMNPYERRVIHSNLQDNEEITTYSIGSEPYRKVVIAPKDAKQYNGNGRRGGYNKKRNDNPRHNDNEIVAEKSGSYTTTYKADFKPQQHKAEYKNFEDYLAAQQAKSEEK